MSLNRFAPQMMLAIVLATLPSIAQAQNRSSHSSTRQERIARASWQPTRNSNTRSESSSALERDGNIRLVQGEETLPDPGAESTPQTRQIVPEPIPAPMRERRSMDSGSYAEMQPMPYYDEPSYGPQYGQPLGCDEMMCSGGGCGGCGGIGCGEAIYCDARGCDSPGCGHAGGACRHRPGWWPCITLCFPRDGWFAADYLMWEQVGMRLPALVTSHPDFSTSPTLATPGTSILYGNRDDYLGDNLNGLRLNFGFWLDPCHEWSVAADYFGFEEQSESVTFTGVPNGDSLGRPFYNVAVALNGERTQLINSDASAPAVTGSVGVDISSQLYSGGFQFRRFLVCRDGCGDTVFLHLPAKFRSRFDLGIGYRYTQLDENLHIEENIAGITAPFAFSSMDDFTTKTQFNGFDFGIYYTRVRGIWSLDMQGRFAIGTNHQTVEIDGSFNGGTSNGGLLAQPSNIGVHERDRISVLPEFRATLGLRLTPRFRLNAGYTFMYWSNVVRPGDHVSLDVDGTQLGTGNYTATRPEFAWNETDFWAHGVSFGGEYRW